MRVSYTAELLLEPLDTLLWEYDSALELYEWENPKWIRNLLLLERAGIRKQMLSIIRDYFY